jgi:DNA-binding winged helix-turn-helix (wHTH) protein
MSKESKPFYEFGPFRFYPEDLVLLCNERNLGLSGKPMDVFFVLFDRRGEPVSKEELLKAVWGKDAGDIRNLYRAIAP